MVVGVVVVVKVVGSGGGACDEGCGLWWWGLWLWL